MLKEEKISKLEKGSNKIGSERLFLAEDAGEGGRLANGGSEGFSPGQSIYRQPTGGVENMSVGEPKLGQTVQVNGRSKRGPEVVSGEYPEIQRKGLFFFFLFLFLLLRLLLFFFMLLPLHGSHWILLSYASQDLAATARVRHELLAAALLE